jgi:hypothetical protein
MSKDPFNGLRYQNRGEGEKCVNKPQQILPIITDMLLNSNIKGKTLPQQKEEVKRSYGNCE